MALEQVGHDTVALALLEQRMAAVDDTSPEIVKLAVVFQQEALRHTLRVLHELGFVVAKDTGQQERPLPNAIFTVMSIYAAGTQHAAHQVAAVRRAFPILGAALDRMLEEIPDGR